LPQNGLGKRNPFLIKKAFSFCAIIVNIFRISESRLEMKRKNNVKTFGAALLLIGASALSGCGTKISVFSSEPAKSSETVSQSSGKSESSSNETSSNGSSKTSSQTASSQEPLSSSSSSSSSSKGPIQLGTPVLTQGGNWLKQTVTASCDAGEASQFELINHHSIDGGETISESIPSTGSGTVRSVSFNVGTVNAKSYSVSDYVTSPNAIQSFASKAVFMMPTPTNGLSASSYESGHYHIGQTVTFTINETVPFANVADAQALFADSYVYPFQGSYPKAGKVRFLYYLGTDISGTQTPTQAYGSETARYGDNLCDMDHTAGSKVWTETKKMTLSSSAKTNYLRGAIYDEHTGLTSPWTLLAEIKPVYDFEAPAINCVNSFSSESTSLFALISQTTITITMYRPACGSAWLGHYRVGTSDSGSYVTVSYPADKEVSTVILTKQNLSGSETNWYVSAYSSCASTSISSPKRSKAIFVPASVAAPSCTHTHAWNSGFFQWRSDSTWKNNSVYNLEKMRIVTQGNAEYDWSYGGMYCTNIAKDETFVPGTSAIGQNAAIESIGQGGGGTFGFSSFCQITYAGVTSKWYQTYCEHDTEINSPTTNFTSSDSITATYRDNTGDYYVYYNFTISGSVYTTTTSYNG
jgi:hypothetical protein